MSQISRTVNPQLVSYDLVAAIAGPEVKADKVDRS